MLYNEPPNKKFLTSQSFMVSQKGEGQTKKIDPEGEPIWKYG